MGDVARISNAVTRLKYINFISPMDFKRSLKDKTTFFSLMAERTLLCRDPGCELDPYEFERAI